MASTETDICNMALSYIGAKTIVSIEDDSERGRMCKLLYRPAVDSILQRNQWRGTSVRIALAAAAAAPLFGYDRKFPLPADCLRVLTVLSESGHPWEVEGRDLLSSEGSPVSIKYIVNGSNPALFSPLLVEAMARELAHRLSVRLSQSARKQAEARINKEESYNLALAGEGKESTPPPVQVSRWISVR